MSDRITLRGVRAYGYHGVLKHERQYGQEFIVDLQLELSLEEAGHSDALSDTLSYAEVAETVVEAVRGEPLKLIEALAQRISDACLAFPLVDAVEVCVHKPRAPISVSFEDVSVTVYRVRERRVMQPHPRFQERRGAALTALDVEEGEVAA